MYVCTHVCMCAFMYVCVMRILRAGVGYNFSRDLHAEVVGQGAFSGAVDSRFIDPANKTNSYWLPSSVPAVKAQPWYRNYMDGNVADNPLHPTVPDKLIGPQTRTNTRRTKYIAVTRLTSDYLQTTGQTRTYVHPRVIVRSCVCLGVVCCSWDSACRLTACLAIDYILYIYCIYEISYIATFTYLRHE